MTTHFGTMTLSLLASRRDHDPGTGFSVGACVVMIQVNAEPGTDQGQLGRIDFPNSPSQLHGASKVYSRRADSGGSTARMQD